MANQKQVERLKNRIKTWNEWRRKYPKEPIDLIRADLNNADLSEADLSGVDLSGADLSGVNFIRANLSGVDLSGADLRYTNLIEANLSGANLSGADLSRADLSRADLRYTNLIEADLSRADLSRADLRYTNLIEANLRGANLSGADLSKQDLSNRNLSGADLSGANLSGVNLNGADLSFADLSRADFSNADLSFANLFLANLHRVHLNGAHLRQANLGRADLRQADLNGADLNGADLSETTLVETDFNDAILTNCAIYGVSVWNVHLNGTQQKNLIITRKTEPTITVDNLKVAQFIYLLINNEEIRDVIDTLAKKVILILGRFTPERKAILDALRDALRNHQRGYLPIVFDFDKPTSQDFTETVSTLAHLSRFVIADLSEPSSIPQELYAIVPHRMVAIQPLFHPTQTTTRDYALFQDLKRKYDWMLPIQQYQDVKDLLISLETKVIEPAERKAQELDKRRQSE